MDQNKIQSVFANTKFSAVEKAFLEISNLTNQSAQIPYVIVDNFPNLGLLTALRFLEWVNENPRGVISLPTGKTPEFFIKWTKYILENWEEEIVKDLLKKYNLNIEKRPDLSQLRFVQIDEFYPISSNQHNSFVNYIRKFYIKGFGLNPDNSLLIDCDQIDLAEGKSYKEVFPDSLIDLSLRHREAKTKLEQLQQESIYLLDQFCDDYEQKIRALGGIGFFLGGIGPDGHIAFNIRGSSHFSTTRLTKLNFETQAVAASDLGGIEISKNRLAITVGLSTITYNKNAVAIIIAAGEAKANVVKLSLESNSHVNYPATVLKRLRNSRFYLTAGAASELTDTVEAKFTTDSWTHEKTEYAVIEICKKIDKFGSKVLVSDLRKDKFARLIPGLNKNTVSEVMETVSQKIMNGLRKEKNQVFLHTGPHHDDIMLGLLPHIYQQLREASNELHFSILTSGFTAVTNKFLQRVLTDTRDFLENKQIGMINYPDFFDEGYKLKWDKDVYHYLQKVADDDARGMARGASHRVVRALVDIYKISSSQELLNRIDKVLNVVDNSYDGEKNPKKIQKLKGMIREFEEELVWAYFGVQVKNIHHSRLGFYTGDIFTEQPNRTRDVIPILEMLRKIQPTVISLAFDPEGSGPDTHYKVLQTIAEALRIWSKEKDLSNLRIWGYRNVWYRFHASEVNVISPISLNGLSSLNDTFKNCYISQVDASFPSYALDGWFSKLAQKIWVEQMRDIHFLMGKDFFYENIHPKLRATHGMIFFKEMSVKEFLIHARELEKSMEGISLGS